MIGKIVKNLTKTKNENSRRFRRDMANALHRRTIRYCAERDPETGAEVIVGRAGEIYKKEDEICVISGDGIAFRGKIDETKISELLSLNGAIFSGADLERGGIERTIVAYYTDY